MRTQTVSTSTPETAAVNCFAATGDAIGVNTRLGVADFSLLSRAAQGYWREACLSFRQRWQRQSPG